MEFPGIAGLGCALGAHSRGRQLTLKVGQEDHGVYALIGENSFECLLRRHKWEQVADLIRWFCEEARPRKYYQWLDDSAYISLLLSDDGEW